MPAPRRKTGETDRIFADDVAGRAFDGEAYRVLALRAETYDAEARTVEAVLATEGRVRIVDYRRWEIMEEILRMDGVRIPGGGQVPLLDTHNRYSIFAQLGSTRSIRVDGGKLVGTRHFDETEEGRKAAEKVRGGHVTDGSIGYLVDRAAYVEPGKTKKIGGREYRAAANTTLRVVTKWTLREDSLVPIGADEAAKIRAAMGNQRGGDPPGTRRKGTKMKFTEWLTERGIDAEALSAEQSTALCRDFEALEKREAEETPSSAVDGRSDEAPASPETIKLDDVRQAAGEAAAEAVRAERTAEADRVRTIGELADLAGLAPDDEVRASALAAPTADEARAMLKKHVEETRGRGADGNVIAFAPAVHTPDHAMTRKILEASLCLQGSRLDDAEIVAAYGERETEEADRMRDIPFLDVLRYAIAIDGRPVPRGREEAIRVAFSGATLSKLAGNIAGKHLMKGYGAPRKTWEKWCPVASVSDFKTQTFIRLTATGELDEVNTAGEVAQDTYEEEYEEGRARTYGKLVWISRQDVYNDDKRAFSRIPYMYGVQGARRVSKLVYTTLLANGNMTDGVALFHATHANLNTSAALTPTNLSAAIAAFLTQTDKRTDPIDVEPAILLIPPELAETGNSLYEGKVVVLTGTTDASRMAQFADAGRLVPVVESRLSNSGYTGYSATSWYVMGSPGEADNITVLFLNGKQSPTVESVDPDANRLAVGYRVYVDAGVVVVDSRTMQLNQA